MSALLDWLFNRAPPTKTIPAEPLAQYPTVADALAAKEAQFGYGEPSSAYMEGQAGRAYGRFEPGGRVDPFVPGRPVGSLGKVLESPSATIMGRPGVSARTQEDLNTALIRAQLAANYLPAAALGLDMRNATADVSGREMTIGGAYSPRTDQMMFMLNDPSALVHEATHRGLRMVKGSSGLPADIERRIGSSEEEFLVRQLMQQYAGDPEQGPVDLQQKAIARINPASRKDIDAMNSTIANMFKERRPRGPR